MSTSTTNSTTTPSSGTSDGDIQDLREYLDALDEQIVDLINARRNVSQTIQRLKVQAGQSRTDLNREIEVIKHYESELGKEGHNISVEILYYSKIGDLS